jgi:nitrogen regulatory protein P-II 1
MLKKIEAIIREDKANDVREALEKIGIMGLNMFEIRGHGRHGGIQLLGRAGSYQVNMLTKIQINIVLSDRNLDETIETIVNAAYPGEPGDGLLFVYPVDEVIRVRTRERGQDAVMYPGDIDEKKGRTKVVG